MNSSKNQNQHILAQIYLKQFGYKKDGEWRISFFEWGQVGLRNEFIRKFTTEVNLFDLPSYLFQNHRVFEENTSRIESEYKKLINNLTYQQRLTGKDEYVLYLFVASILCKTKHFRQQIDTFLKDPRCRKKLIYEITQLSRQYTENLLNAILDLSNPKDHLNIITNIILEDISYKLTYFDYIIIEDYDNYGWITTDNPVYIDQQNNYNFILPIESEIYLPLSKNFCLFMFNQDSKLKSNPLRELTIKRINKVDFLLFDKVSKIIYSNLYRYLILPLDL